MAIPEINRKAAGALALISPQMRCSQAAGARTSQQSGLHLSELLTSLLDPPVIPTTGDKSETGLGLRVPGWPLFWVSHLVQKSCFITRNKTIISTPNRNSNPDARALPIIRNVGREA